MNKFYSSISDVYDYIFPPSKAQTNFILSEIDTPSQKNILDIGCGTGNLSSSLAKHFKSVQAVDLDMEMINKANEKYRLNNLFFSCADMLKISEYFKSDKFDSIDSFGNTLVHLDSPDEILNFFNETKKLLNDSGKLLIQIINYDRILTNNVKSLQTIDNEHIKFERYYNYLSDKHKIEFKTILTIKESNQIIHNSVNLYPLLKEETNNLLLEAGFQHISFYGNFMKEKYSINSIPLIFEAY
ncbi:MAG TPA: class I SAM-dependent methyltransferase [Victivallales bacterium]|nr:class I SAM-dependent methyltransferase [Victivallales bacterium]